MIQHTRKVYLQVHLLQLANSWKPPKGFAWTLKLNFSSACQRHISQQAHFPASGDYQLPVCTTRAANNRNVGEGDVGPSQLVQFARYLREGKTYACDHQSLW